MSETTGTSTSTLQRTPTAIVQHWINGQTVDSESGRTAPVFDPALGVQTKSVALATARRSMPQ